MVKNLVFSFLMMLISPVLTVIVGFREKSFEFRRALLTLGITFYGSIISLSETTDGYEHYERVLNHYTNLEFNQFFYELIAILNFASFPTTNDDVFIHLLSYFVGSILQIPQLFFVFVSFIYGYFFSGSVLKVVTIIPKTKVSYLFYAFAIIFILIKNIEGINTVRTWTGLWILFYAAFSYFETNNRKYLFLMFVPPLIHVGYFVMAIPVWVVTLFGSKYRLIYLGIFIISFIGSLPQNTILDKMAGTELGKSKSEAYYVDDIEEYEKSKIKKDSTWYLVQKKLKYENYSTYLIIFTLVIGGIYFIGMDKLESNLFSVGLLSFALSNFMEFIFAIHNRLALIGIVFIIATLVLLLKRNYFNEKQQGVNFIYHLLFSISILLYIPFIIYKIANLIYFISVFVFALPFIPWINSEYNFSIREFLGWLIGK